jgi:hypothetical protein
MAPFETDADLVLRKARERTATRRRAEHCALHSKLLTYEIAAAPLTLEPDRRQSIETALRLILQDALAIAGELGIDVLQTSVPESSPPISKPAQPC